MDHLHKYFFAHHPVLNQVLPWVIFLIVFLTFLQFVMWPLALLGGIVIAAVVADHFFV